jgi:circadian clock protein KaiC
MMAVVKVRGSAHSDELRLFDINDEGIQIRGMITDQEGLLGGRPTRKHPGDSTARQSGSPRE